MFFFLQLLKKTYKENKDREKSGKLHVYLLYTCLNFLSRAVTVRTFLSP